MGVGNRLRHCKFRHGIGVCLIINTAAEAAYCDDLTGMLAEHGLVVSELTSHIFGQLMAVHPAYDIRVLSSLPSDVHAVIRKRAVNGRGNSCCWPVRPPARLGLGRLGTFSGSLAWPICLPFPQRQAGLIEAAFDELARRWLPVSYCDEQGIQHCVVNPPVRKIYMMA